MEIKPVDLETIWKIRQAVMYPDLPVEAVKLPEDDAGEHAGLYDQGKLVSIISVFKNDREWQFRKFATLTDRQGRGYGTILLQHVFERAKAAGSERIWCNARLSATALYEKFGMHRTGQPWNKFGIDFIKMEKRIG